MTYALGRGLEYNDAPAVRGITRRAQADGNRFSSVVLGIVNSTPFRMRRAARGDGAPASATNEERGRGPRE